jgi:hypothetical protein
MGSCDTDSVHRPDSVYPAGDRHSTCLKCYSAWGHRFEKLSQVARSSLNSGLNSGLHSGITWAPDVLLELIKQHHSRAQVGPVCCECLKITSLVWCNSRIVVIPVTQLV